MQLGNTNKNLTINGNSYSFIKKRTYKDVWIYGSNHGYLRIGEAKDLHKEIKLQKYLQKNKFPIPHLIEHGTLNGYTYFIEENTGDETISNLFIRQNGTQTNKQLMQLYKILGQYSEAQALTIKSDNYINKFLEGSKYDEVAENEVKGDLKKKMIDTKAKLLHELAHAPYVFSHGDLNPWNILSTTIIDFEYNLWAPFGYDLLTCILNDYNFPLESGLEKKRSNEFSKAFRNKVINYIIEFSKEKLNTSVENILEAIYLPKLAFSVGNIDRTPKIQIWRFNLLEECIDLYLADKSYMNRLIKGV